MIKNRAKQGYRTGLVTYDRRIPNALNNWFTKSLNLIVLHQDDGLQSHYGEMCFKRQFCDEHFDLSC